MAGKSGSPIPLGANKEDVAILRYLDSPERARVFEQAPLGRFTLARVQALPRHTRDMILGAIEAQKRRSRRRRKRQQLASAPQSPITIDQSCVFVKGQRVQLNVTPERLTDVLHFLNQLIRKLGLWVSGSEISKAEPTKYNDRYRWDRVQKSLPRIIREQIETDRRKGKRLKPLGER
jgi:hypothetical protein